MAGINIDPKQQQPMIHFSQYPAGPPVPQMSVGGVSGNHNKMPVKINSVNFDGVFRSGGQGQPGQQNPKYSNDPS